MAIKIPNDSQCLACRHFLGVRPDVEEDEQVFQCNAFQRIPTDVILNRIDHRQPIEDDGGIQWLGKPGEIHPLP